MKNGVGRASMPASNHVKWCVKGTLRKTFQTNFPWACGPAVKDEKTGGTGFPACAKDSRGWLSYISEGIFQTRVLNSALLLDRGIRPEELQILAVAGFFQVF